MQGCDYNTKPVFTSLPCTLASPPLPPAPPTDFPIPQSGVAVLDGSLPGATQLGCLRPGVDDGTTTSPGGKITPGDEIVIAAQCCRAGKSDPQQACVRWIGSQPAGCIAGKPPTAMTYSAAAELCAQKRHPDEPDVPLQLCSMSCAGKGCEYNSWPVYSTLPCQ